MNCAFGTMIGLRELRRKLWEPKLQYVDASEHAECTVQRHHVSGNVVAAAAAGMVAPQSIEQED